MKKDKKHYESPKMEVIEMNRMAILVSSGDGEGTLPGIGEGGSGF